MRTYALYTCVYFSSPPLPLSLSLSLQPVLIYNESLYIYVRDAMKLHRRDCDNILRYGKNYTFRRDVEKAAGVFLFVLFQRRHVNRHLNGKFDMHLTNEPLAA